MRKFLVSVLVLSLLALTACTNAYQGLQDTAQAGTLAATATDTLYKDQVISSADATTVLKTGYTTVAALEVWQTAVNNPNISTATVANDASAAIAALTQLDTELSGFETTLVKEGKLKLKSNGSTTTFVSDIPEVITVLNEILQLDPQLQAFISGLENPATNASVSTAIANFNTALTTLQADIDGK
jgi:hypothetical protein